MMASKITTSVLRFTYLIFPLFHKICLVEEIKLFKDVLFTTVFFINFKRKRRSSTLILVKKRLYYFYQKKKNEYFEIDRVITIHNYYLIRTIDFIGVIICLNSKVHCYSNIMYLKSNHSVLN